MWRWEMLLLLQLAFASIISAKLTDLGEEPDWSRLDAFQESISREDFLKQLNKVYCPRSEWWAPWLEIGPSSLRIRTKSGTDSWYEFHFEQSKQVGLEARFSPIPKNLKIVLDPGHIGGDFSEMEGRHFAIGDDLPVKEGELALEVALLLKTELESRQISVFLTREENQPVTHARPSDFQKLAMSWYQRTQAFTDYNESVEAKMIRDRRELYFYRVSEINARAKMIDQVKPDLVICIHLNAAPWSDPDSKTLVERNDYHVLLNGCYMGGEIAYDNQRFQMIWRIVNNWHETEKEFAQNIARSFAENSKLPPFSYKGPNAIKIGSVPGVWARNLLANRIYEAPVVFLEPYIANSRVEYERIQMGNYDGFKKLNGVSRLSLVQEYVKAVMEGIEEYFGGK